MAASTPRLMPMDVYRDADNYVLNADLPGIDPQSVDVDVDGQLLSIRAERTTPAKDGVRWIARERSAGATCAGSPSARASTPPTSRRATTTAC